ncbi:centromere protein T isoform X2 [Hypomesus transpacificus]|uniref:centromere protein T isoform X2 n=1 Tax=Hypomesus transpacificus TaxID=137520 RepID=UPI001F07745E|nr:centromere protein T isoform X2 [Hypomesus transpacificus]
MDSVDEDLSARILLKNVLHAEPSRSPVTRRASKAQPPVSGPRHSARLRRSEAGALTPQEALRHSMKQKLRESTSSLSLPPNKRRTVSTVVRKVNIPTPTAVSLLYHDEDITPRHLLRGILQTEPETSLLIQDRPIRKELVLPSADSSLNSNCPSTGLSGLDLPDLTTMDVCNPVKALSRKRPRRSLNVTAFEGHLEDGGDQEGAKSAEDLSALSSNSLNSVTLSLKTPFVDKRPEIRGLQRKVEHCHKIDVEEFDAAVQGRERGGHPDLSVGLQSHCETVEQEGFTLHLTDLNDPDLTSDIIGSTELYAQPATMSETFTITQDKDTVTATQMQRDLEGVKDKQEGEEMELEERTERMSGETGQRGGSLRPEGTASQTEEVDFGHFLTGEENAVGSQTGVGGEREAAGTSQTSEENDQAESQTGEEEEGEEAAESQTGEEQEEQEAAESQTGEQEAPESQTGEQEAPESQTGGEEVESQTGEQEAPESQTGGEEVESQTGEQEAPESQTGGEVVESQTGEEKAAESQTGEEEEQQQQQEAAESQTGEEEAESQTGEAAVECDWEDGGKRVSEHFSQRAFRSEGGAKLPVIMEGGRGYKSMGETLHPTNPGGAGRRAEGDLPNELQSGPGASESQDLHTVTLGSVSPSPHHLGNKAEQGGPSGAEDSPGHVEENSMPPLEMIAEPEYHTTNRDSSPLHSQSQVEEEEEGGEEEEEGEDGSESEELSMKTPAFVRERRKAPSLDTLATPTVFRESQPSVSVGGKKPKAARKKRATSTKDSGLPKSYIMSVFKHFAKTKVSADVYPVLKEIMERYFDRLSDDLETFAAHAKRKTIEVEDVELLLRRQGFVTECTPVNVLIEKYLPMEYRKLLIPVATSGNQVIPKQKR